jgi:uncharacterized protein
VRTLLLASSFLPCLGAHAAGFDCKGKGLKEVERTICSTPRLSSFDDQLSSLFTSLMRLSEEQARNTLRKEQREWLRDSRDRCSAEECLDRVYVLRIAELTALHQQKLRDKAPPEILDELSKRSGIPESELPELLVDCKQHQLAMNICAFRAAVEADLKMERVLAEVTQALPGACGVSLQTKQKTWAEQLNRRCEKLAEEQAVRVSAQPMIASNCIADAIVERTSVLRAVESCASIP